MKKNYNRLCVSISNETNSKLESMIENKKIQALTKSAIVELALIKFFEINDADISEQLVVG